MKQGQETNQIWTQEAGTDDTQNRTLTLLPPPRRRVPRRNSSTGEGGWALWRPLRTNTERNTGRGPSERNRQTGTMAELGALEAMAVQGAQEAMVELGALAAMAELGALEAMAVQGAQEELWRPWRSWELWRPWRCRELRRPWQMDFGALASVPSARPLQPELILPPPKKIPWGSEGVSEPSGAKQTGHYKTRQERPPGPDRQDRTAHRNRKPSRAIFGSWGFLWAWRVRGPHRVPQQPLSSLRQGRQVAGMASAATKQGAACTRRVSMNKTDMMIKMFLWAQHDLKTCLWGHGTALLAVMWTRSTGLGLAAASRHESAPIRWAWVSGDPTGLSQRRSGGLESAAIRRALSQRRARGHWVRGGPVAWSPANGAPGGAATRELGNPPAGLGEPPPAADISRDRRAWGLVASGLVALAAIPPNSHALLQWAMAGLRAVTSLSRDRHKQTHWSKIKLSKTKTKRGEWAPLTVRSGLLSRCTHEGGTGTRRRGHKHN